MAPFPALAIELSLRVEKIVFTGNVVRVEARLRNDAVGVVELRRLGQMADVSGVDHERRLDWERLDAADRLLARAERIGVGWVVQADVAVGGLQDGRPA